MWPDIFFYSTNNTCERFSTLPPGNLNVERLINQEPCFSQYNESLQTKRQKILIITDWTAPKWNVLLIKSIKDALIKLIETGFTIYIWQEDHLDTMTIDKLPHLYDPAYRYNIKLISLEEIIAITGNKQLTQESVFLLDDYWINIIANKQAYNLQKLPDRHLKLEDLVNILHHWIDIEKAIQLSQQSLPPLQGVMYKKVKYQKEQVFRLGKNYDSVQHETHYDQIFSTVSLMKVPMCETESEPETQALNENTVLYEISNEKINNIREICLININTDEISLINFLKINNTIFDLTILDATISYLKIENGEMSSNDDQKYTFNHLRSLCVTMDGAPIKAINALNTVNKIISMSPNLETLIVTYAANPLCPALNFNNNKKLTRVRLIDTFKLSDNDLINFLNKNRKIKELHLENSIDLLPSEENTCSDTLLIQDHLFLDNLSELTINLHRFLFLFQATTMNNISSLTIMLTNDQEVNILLSIIKSHHFNHLKHIKISCTSLSDNTMQESIIRLAKANAHCQFAPKLISINSKPINQILNIHIKPTKNEKKFDANTKFDVTTLNMNTTFQLLSSSKPIIHKYYRLGVFDTVIVTNEICDTAAPFTATVKECNIQSISKSRMPIQLIAINESLINTFKNEKENYYYHETHLTLTKEWQALPSIHHLESLTHYLIISNHHATPDIEIGYDESLRLYYVKGLVEYQEIDFAYILKVPPNRHDTFFKAPMFPWLHTIFNTSIQCSFSSQGNPYMINQDIDTLIQHYFRFGIGELKLATHQNLTGIGFIEAIHNQQLGACRHRAIAFLYFFNQQFSKSGYKAYMVTNNLHAFIEIAGDDKRYLIDLGGYPTLTRQNQKDKSPSIISDAELEEAIDDSETTTLTSANHPTLVVKKLAADHYNALVNQYKKAIKQQVSQKSKSIKQFAQKIISKNNIKKCNYLIRVNNEKDIPSIILYLETCFQNEGIPSLYIQQPKSLTCVTPYIKSTNNIDGCVAKGANGETYEFIRSENGNKRVFLVNYAAFNDKELVSHHGFIDSPPQIDGFSLPDKLLVIAIIPSDRHLENDITSRFHQIIHEPFLDDIVKVNAPDRFIADPFNTIKINLYHSADWKVRLLGGWRLNKDTLTFESGSLSTLLSSAHPLHITIQNKPHDDNEFTFFWQEAAIKGEIYHAGHRIKIPPITWTFENGYDNWEEMQNHLHILRSKPDHAHTLNPTMLNKFFTQYHIDPENASLDQQPGIIAASSGNKCSVILTRHISEDALAKLLAECMRYGVILEIYCTPNTNLPLPNQTCITEAIKPIDFHHCVTDFSFSLPDIKVIHSTEPATTIHMISQYPSPQPIVIDVSEAKPSDLLWQVSATFDEEKLQFNFTKNRRFLVNALHDGKHVILKGDFSAELVDYLADFILTQENIHGKLTIVTTDANHFSYCHIVQHHVSAKDIMACIIHFLKMNDMNEFFLQNTINEILENEMLAQQSLWQLITRIEWLIHQTTGSAWDGMYTLSREKISTNLDTDTSLTESNTFIRERLSAVQNRLAYAPYIYITGLSGVGKSTFIQQHLCQANDRLFQGETEILKWAEDNNTKGYSYLFIDEANLSASQFSQFAFFNQPPGVLIDGIYHILSPKHKVIFAGNPLNYGDTRHLAPLFIEHGGALVFQPMPIAFIFEKILKPIFPIAYTHQDLATICKPFLNIYQFLCDHAKDEILISPRELEMMLILTLTFMERSPTSNIKEVAAYYAYQIGTRLILPSMQNDFDAQFKPSHFFTLRTPTIEKEANTAFHQVASRQPIIHYITDCLQLRSYRREQKNLTEKQLYGGLGGFIVEGEPGIGKSDLIKWTLLSQGYTPFDSSSEEKNNDKNFMYIPTDLTIDEKRNRLLLAFDQGMIVIIDEINSCGFDEQLLNSLLMGRNVDGKHPALPGFMLIGTQNPATMSGRDAMSTALSRRLLTLNLPLYSESEMIDILEHQGLPKKEAKTLVQAYCEYKAEEKNANNHANACYTFRELLQLAKKEYNKRMKPKNVFFSTPSVHDKILTPKTHSRLV